MKIKIKSPYYKRTRIVVIFSDINKSSITGQQKIGKNLVEILLKNNFKILIISNDTSISYMKKDKLNCSLEILKIPGKSSFLTYLIYLNKILKTVEKYKPEIIHGNGLLSSLLSTIIGKKLKIPIVQTICQIDNFNTLLGRIFSYNLYFVDHIICTSNYIKNFLISRGIPANKLSVVYYGIDSRWITHKEPNFNTNRKTVRILFLGDAHPSRGIDIVLKLIKQMRRYTNLQFVFAIRNYYYNYEKILRKLSRRYSIKLFGKLSEKKLYSLLNSSDIIIIPYKKTTIQPPLTLLESLASGNLVITTNVDANREFIADNERGIIVHSNDVKKFKEILSRFIIDWKKRKIIGRKAKYFIFHNYNYETVFKKLYTIYNALIK